MTYVEMQPIAVGPRRQAGLAMRSIEKDDLRRVDAQVTPQDDPKQAASDDVPSLVAPKMKTPRALEFIARKRFFALVERRRRLVQPPAPEVNFMIRQRGFWRRLSPSDF